MKQRDYRNVYIGPLIQQKVDERHMTYAEFARLIHCERSNVYRIFRSKSIDVERLLLISEVLKYDFIHEVYLPEAKGALWQHSLEEGDESPLGLPCIVLPIRDGRVPLSHLPQNILTQLRDFLDSHRD